MPQGVEVQVLSWAQKRKTKDYSYEESFVLASKLLCLRRFGEAKSYFSPFQRIKIDELGQQVLSARNGRSP